MRTSVRAGLSLAQIGEFSFIIAGLGLTLRATGEFLYAVAVAVSALTTLFTPWMIRASDGVAAWIDRKLPRSLQTFAALYGSWIEGLRARRHEETALRAVRRRARLMILDTLVLAGIIIGTALAATQLAAQVEARIGVPADLAGFIIVAAGIALAVPFVIGLVRVGRRLGAELAALMLPPKTGVDPGVAPRRVLGVTLQIACVLVVGLPLAALTQPFVPNAFGVAILAVLLAALAVSFWRNAANLQEHVRAGAQVIVGAIAARSRGRVPDQPASLPEVAQLLPGFGALVAVPLSPASPAVGKTLAELNLRGRTGATVLAITGRDEPVLAPGAQERLRVGDVLALAGTDDAIAEARVRLSVA
jgi:CPA2 family monovalent cation:H+ antiporter-2